MALFPIGSLAHGGQDPSTQEFAERCECAAEIVRRRHLASREILSITCGSKLARALVVSPSPIPAFFARSATVPAPSTLLT